VNSPSEATFFHSNQRGNSPLRGLLIFGFFDEFAQAIETPLPDGSMIGNPSFQGVETGRFDAARAYATDLFSMSQAALFKDLEMLCDRSNGDAERFGQCGHGGGTVRQAVKHGAPGWIAQGMEEAIDVYFGCRPGALAGVLR